MAAWHLSLLSGFGDTATVRSCEPPLSPQKPKAPHSPTSLSEDPTESKDLNEGQTSSHDQGGSTGDLSTGQQRHGLLARQSSPRAARLGSDHALRVAHLCQSAGCLPVPSRQTPRLILWFAMEEPSVDNVRRSGKEGGNWCPAFILQEPQGPVKHRSHFLSYHVQCQEVAGSGRRARTYLCESLMLPRRAQESVHAAAPGD